MGEVRRPYYYVTDSETGKKVRRTSSIWWLRYYRDGRRHEESSHTTRKGEAQRLLKIREGKVAEGVPVSAKVGRLRFDEAAADVITDYRVNGKRSLGDVETRIRLHLKPFFGGRRMASIATADVRRYVASRQAPIRLEDGTEKPGAAAATINRELAALKRAFTLALQAGTLLHVPHIPMLKEDNVRTGFFEREEFEAVQEHLPAPLQSIITFAYFTGWRIPSEVLPLTWGQVDRRSRTIRLEPGTTKNKEGRNLPYDLLPELVDVIERQWEEHRRLAAEGVLCPHVFHRDGAEIKGFRKAWKSACKAAGCPGKLLHDFRRTAIRNMVRAGVPDTVAMKISGHTTRSVFDRYAVANEADLRSALGKLTGKGKGRSAESGRVLDFADSSQASDK